MVKVELNGQTYEATSMPIILHVTGTSSMKVFTFFINGKEYTGEISQYGKLTIDRKK